eukprot:s473_g27.t1
MCGCDLLDTATNRHFSPLMGMTSCINRPLLLVFSCEKWKLPQKWLQRLSQRGYVAAAVEAKPLLHAKDFDATRIRMQSTGTWHCNSDQAIASTESLRLKSFNRKPEDRTLLLTWRGEHAESASRKDVREGYLEVNETVRPKIIQAYQYKSGADVGRSSIRYAFLMGNSHFCLAVAGGQYVSLKQSLLDVSRLFERMGDGRDGMAGLLAAAGDTFLQIKTYTVVVRPFEELLEATSDQKAIARVDWVVATARSLREKEHKHLATSIAQGAAAVDVLHKATNSLEKYLNEGGTLGGQESAVDDEEFPFFTQAKSSDAGPALSSFRTIKHQYLPISNLVLMAQAIVVGGGLAGVSAANTVLECGGKVVLVDKSAFCGGNSTKATSGINGAETQTQKAKKVEDSVQLFTSDTLKGGAKKPELVKVLCGNSGPDVDWLVDKFDLDMISERSDLARIINKAKVKQLVTKAGAVSGVIYEKKGKDFTEDGPVILATGGFGADFTDDSWADSLLAKYRPDLLHLPTTNGDHTTGDGIKMGEAIGARSIDLEWVQVHPTGLVEPDDPEAKIKFLAAEALRGVGGLVINADGQRFCNELGRRDYVTGEMWKSKPPFRLILNKAASDEIIWHCKHYTGRGVMKFYESGEALCKDMSIPLSTLEATHQSHFESAKKQEKDPEGGPFPAYPSGKTWDEPSGQTGSGKKFFHNIIDGSKVKTEPFYSAIITPVIHYCMGGLEIDEDSAVVSQSGKAIPGLYAAGEVAGGVHGNNRLGGNSLLDCVVFGRVAGKHCAKYMLGDKFKAMDLKELSGGGLTDKAPAAKLSLADVISAVKSEVSQVQIRESTDQAAYVSLLEVAKQSRRKDAFSLTDFVGGQAALAAESQKIQDRQKALKEQLGLTDQLATTLTDECEKLLADFEEKKKARNQEIDALDAKKKALDLWHDFFRTHHFHPLGRGNPLVVAMPQKTQPMSRGPPERGELRFSQTRPSQHAENQYEGFFKGMGATSKDSPLHSECPCQPINCPDVICSKKASQLKRLHEATHFAIGCQKWDEDTRGASVTHSTFVDPEVVYATCDAPDKNMSVVELRQQVFKPASHYRTEQRDRFDDPGPQPRNDTLVPSVTVHLGDDRPGYSLQSHAVHRKIPSEEQDGAKALRAAGSGILIPTAVFPKPVRCNPVTGGPRTPDVYDLGVANQVRHDRVSQNSSSIIREAHVRNPISGDCIPLQQYANPRGEVELYSGRLHQIRAHLSSEGFPLLGDWLYGEGNVPWCSRIFLHAAFLRPKLSG